MSKLNKKTYRDYIIKVGVLIILIIMLVSSIISCSLKNWKNDTWPNKICPININVIPANPKILSQFTRSIPCSTQKKHAKYKLIINHNFKYHEIVISGQNAAKTRPYDFYFIVSLNKDKKEIIRPFKILLTKNAYTSIIKPFDKNIDNNQLTSNVGYLINQLIQIINKKLY